MAHTDPTLFRHRPVLEAEVAALLGPALGPGRTAVDCTAGGGGHTARLLTTGARVIAVDRDPDALAAVKARLADAPGLTLVHGDFGDLPRLVTEPVHAVLADLGVSSPQLDRPERGFGFSDGPLDMRMDPTSGAPLSERLETVDQPTLARIIKEYGEERRASAVARAILTAFGEGTLTGTARLAEVVARAVGRSEQRIHPATRTFQALRIWVNDELGALERLLAALPDLLVPGGRAAVISFHSLEDRRVKQAFRDLSTGCICPPDFPVCRCGRTPRFDLITRRAVKATAQEVAENPRARSARLRVVEKREEGA